MLRIHDASLEGVNIEEALIDDSFGEMKKLNTIMVEK